MAIKFLNDVAVDSDVLYVDTASGNVGVGITSPSHALDVSGTIATDSGFLVVATLPALTFIDSSGGGEIYTSAGSMNFKTGVGTPTNKMSILSGGNVGIGTTSPRGTLDINGPLSVIGGTFTSGASGADSNASAGIVLRRGKKLMSGIPSGGNQDFYLRSLLEQTTSGAIIIGQGGTGLISDIALKPGTSGNITFFASGSEDMRINSSGNVGIGTTDPDTFLHIDSNSTNNIPLKVESGTTSSYMQFMDTGTTADYKVRVGSIGDDLALWAGGSERARVKSTGNVGIGTTNPGRKLTLEGGGFSMFADGGTSADAFSVTTHNYAFADENEDAVYSYNGTDGHIFSTGGSPRVNIKQNGNVGINTTNPTEKLTVSGNAYITNNVYVGSGNTLKSCTYPAQYSLAVGQSNILGGISNGIIGVSNTIDCTAEPWLSFGGNFIAGVNNNILGQYSHANAVFGQQNELGTSSINNANTLIGGSEHEVTSSNALLFGTMCRAFSASYSLTGGFDSNNFGGFGSVAIGAGATASTGNNQYAFGSGVTTPTTASAAYGADQFVVGKFNEYTNASSVPHRFAVGNGASDASRNTPFCVIGGGTYTNGQVSINDADGFAYTTVPYSVFHVNGRATSSYSSTFTTTSDERVKKNIVDYSKGLAEIIQVQPKSYAFNGKGNTIEDVESIGVLAQEIKDVFPETVGTVNKKLNPEDEQETELYTVDISPVTYALINAVKELNAKVEALEARIQTLEGN